METAYVVFHPAEGNVKCPSKGHHSEDEAEYPAAQNGWTSMVIEAPCCGLTSNEERGVEHARPRRSRVT